MKALWNGAVLAESDSTLEVEGNHYFPPDSIDRRYFERTRRKSLCPWKGIATYYTVEVDGERYERAAWTYRHPSPLARRIKNHVAFSDDVEVVPMSGPNAR
jgi:uncharacterized protein (DUF427 family)